MTRRMWVATGLAVSLLVSPTASSAERGRGGTGVTLYEVSERVTFDPDPSAPGVVLRNATASLLGVARLGTPLCPKTLRVAFPEMQRCNVIAHGSDNVSMATGTGPVTGTFDIVVNAPGSSSVHVPSLPVISGTFSGSIDLSLAVHHGVPLGSITGTFTIPTVDQTGHPALAQVPFSGTFRLPFAIDDLGRAVTTDDDDTHEAYYLADDMQNLIEVRDNERSVGFPLVRLELRFP